jgi:hypothetical protein
MKLLVVNVGELIELPLLETTAGTWVMLTKGTERLIAIRLVGEHRSGQIIYFSHTGSDSFEMVSSL